MNSKCGMLNAECGRNAAASRFARASAPIPHSAFGIRHSTSGLQPTAYCLQPSRAITLIELLITMTIIAIISALIMGTAAAAIENAREKNTQALITKIHTLIMERYSSYETRRVDIDPRITSAVNAWAAPKAGDGPNSYKERNIARGQMLADARLLGIRELMKKEMPDRKADVEHRTLILSQPPPLAKTYHRIVQQLPTGAKLSPAECLYMVVMNATGDGEARTLFSKQDIGDVNENGLPEFVDGWGNPIGWIRWPAGIVSDLQPLNPDGTRPGENDHDPFDLFRRDSPTVTAPVIGLYPTEPAGQQGIAFGQTYRINMWDRMQQASPINSHLYAYRLTPLIYSAGPDGDSAMKFGDEDMRLPLDPYYVNPDDGFQAGSSSPEQLNATKDNITNHLIEY